MFRVSDVGPASLEVEQLSVISTAKPAGAGNTGTFNISSGPGFVAPTEVANGSLTADTSQGLAQVHGNTMTGSGMEISIGGASTFGLDLEDNTTNGLYDLFVPPTSTAVLSVEQLSALTTPKPGGAGNVGTLDDGTGIGGLPPVDVANGSLGL